MDSSDDTSVHQELCGASKSLNIRFQFPFDNVLVVSSTKCQVAVSRVLYPSSNMDYPSTPSKEMQKRHASRFLLHVHFMISHLLVFEQYWRCLAGIAGDGVRTKALGVESGRFV